MHISRCPAVPPVYQLKVSAAKYAANPSTESGCTSCSESTKLLFFLDVFMGFLNRVTHIRSAFLPRAHSGVDRTSGRSSRSNGEAANLLRSLAPPHPPAHPGKAQRQTLVRGRGGSRVHRCQTRTGGQTDLHGNSIQPTTQHKITTSCWPTCTANTPHLRTLCWYFGTLINTGRSLKDVKLVTCFIVILFWNALSISLWGKGSCSNLNPESAN